MSSLLFTLFYILMSVCFIFPPNEFVSAGLTVECLFSHLFPLLGSENEYFIQYHIRRSVATIICHSVLPFGYMIGLYFLGYADTWDTFWQGSVLWQVFVAAAFLIPLTALYFVWSWWHDHWKLHPISRTLASFQNFNSSWSSVASDINVEYRRVDKICIQTNSVVKVIATDNWLIKVSPYWLDVAHQSDTALILSSTDTHQVTPTGPLGAQYLNIEVKSVRRGLKPFSIRLNALDFKDLQDKVSRPIIILENIRFHQTLVDRFLDAFREQVALNPKYETEQELELCIGCMQMPSNVKLQKSCGDITAQGNSCSTCYCRPMWCLDCMGKWFASRQDQNHPETWLSSKCTCPMCRNKFCVLDVCQVQPR